LVFYEAEYQKIADKLNIYMEKCSFVDNDDVEDCEGWRELDEKGMFLNDKLMELQQRKEQIERDRLDLYKNHVKLFSHINGCLLKQIDELKEKAKA
jgi:FMN phosphatase YigB (HAD superfamily)